MYIENGNTLVVKSGIDYFEKERSGKKPNTYRDYDDNVGAQDISNITIVKVISVQNPFCSFTREIVDLSPYKKGIIISWEHSNGTN